MRIIGSILIVCFLLIWGCCDYKCQEVTSGESAWELYEANPVIKYGQAVHGMVWNDPSVMKEGDIYRMWLSGGIGRGFKPPVKIYEAWSKDGLDWDINPTPLLEQGASGQWDDEKVETPAVIKVGETYHMYYCACTKKYNECNKGIYNIGHAVSTDGKNWVKDPKNPVVTHTADPLHWGFYTAAEPAVAYVNGKFYLYYTTVKHRAGYEGVPDISKKQWICLATSSDGSNFMHYDADNDGYRDAVLKQSENYPVSEKYIGYSTPWVLVDSEGVFHLFYDVVQYPKRGDWRQVALAHAVSNDGLNFTEVECDIITRGSQYWLAMEVRSPSVIEEGDSFKMWFAGHTNWLSSSGIGYAVLKVGPEEE